jgi:hypothetical protein
MIHARGKIPPWGSGGLRPDGAAFLIFYDSGNTVAVFHRENKNSLISFFNRPHTAASSLPVKQVRKVSGREEFR